MRVGADWLVWEGLAAIQMCSRTLHSLHCRSWLDRLTGAKEAQGGKEMAIFVGHGYNLTLFIRKIKIHLFFTAIILVLVLHSSTYTTWHVSKYFEPCPKNTCRYFVSINERYLTISILIKDESSPYSSVLSCFAAMMTYLDDAFANVTKVLKQTGMWNNTILVFSSGKEQSFWSFFTFQTLQAKIMHIRGFRRTNPLKFIILRCVFKSA